MSNKCKVTLPLFQKKNGGYEVTRTGFLDLPGHLAFRLPGVSVTMEVPVATDPMGSGLPFQRTLYKITRKRVTVYPGYWWDGATCGFEFKDFAYAALFHDIVCDSIDTGLIHPSNQKTGDVLMRRVAIEHGFNRFWAWVRFWGVRLHRNKKASMMLNKFGWHLR